MRTYQIVTAACAAAAAAAIALVAVYFISGSSQPAWCDAANHERIVAGEPARLQHLLRQYQYEQALSATPGAAAPAGSLDLIGAKIHTLEAVVKIIKHSCGS
jgi:hypothetical protein